MSHPAGSAKLLRALNERAALRHLLDNGALTRQDLRELTGLSKPTSSEMLRALTEAGLAQVTGYTSGGPGPNAEIYAANPEAAYAAAVSVREYSVTGAPTLGTATVDITGATRARAEAEMPDEPGLRIAAAVRDQLTDAGLDPGRLRHVQLAVPGSYDSTTDTIHHVDVPGLSRPGLVGELARELGTSVYVDNDVNLAAVAERRHGVAAGAEAFALLWLSGGLGLAIDLGGTLLRGARGGAGEIGYMPLGLPGEARSDLHDVAAGRAVLALAMAYGLDGDTPGQAVATAVAKGDGEFIAALAQRIAPGLAAVVAVLDPPLVVLAGEIGRAGGEALRDAARAALREWAPFDTEIAVTGVADDAALLGAVDAALHTMRDQLISSL